jgi:hypothetical protein
MDVLSPELVLVDPVLAAEARRLLPDPPDCLALRQRSLEDPRPDAAAAGSAPPTPRIVVRLAPSVSAGAATVAPPTPASLSVPHGHVVAAPRASIVVAAPPRAATVPFPVEFPAHPSRWRPSFLAVLAALLVALVVGLPAFDLIPWDSKRPSFAETGDGASDATPKADVRVTPPTEAVADINLRWPRAKGADFYNVVLWRSGRRVVDLWPRTNRVQLADGATSDGRKLAPGRYQWFAFAAFKNGAKTRFGHSLANGEFRIRDVSSQSSAG